MRLGFGLVILLNGLSLLPLATAVLLLDFLCCFSKVLSWREALASVNGHVVVTIASSFGISAALTRTGAARALATGLLAVGLPLGPPGVLCMVYAGTALLTNIISNTATCIMMIPVAHHISQDLDTSSGMSGEHLKDTRTYMSCMYRPARLPAIELAASRGVTYRAHRACWLAFAPRKALASAPKASSCW